jgi:uncharacterized protein with GYD domain
VSAGNRLAAATPVALNRYAAFFKYADQAIKAMTDNPQDRTAAVTRSIEAR